MPYKFTTVQVAGIVASADGDYDDGIDAFASVSHTLSADGHERLQVELTSTEEDEADRTTEKFRVQIHRMPESS